MRALLAAVVALHTILTLTAFGGAHAQASERYRAMNQPLQPFRLIDNVYHVGASDVTSFLIATPAGHILLDGGFVETAPQILQNVQTLGFRREDIQILLNSHAHLDHAGGLAALKEATGARLFASPRDAVLLANGGQGDFQFGDSLPFPPVEVDSLIGDGDAVELGGVRLRAHATPGHTPGCTTWSMVVQEDGQQYHVLFLCSVSAPGYRLVGNAAYPSIARDFESTFAKLRQIPCEVFLGAHGIMFSLQEKVRRLHNGERPNPFVDPAGCRAHLNQAEGSFREQLEEQQRRVSGRSG